MNSESTVTCLNCGHPASSHYCCYCGQATDTRRYTLIHVVKKDILKWMLFYNKGLFYTLWKLFTRPGHSIREYVQGKRVNHLGYISLLLVSILLFTLAEKLTGFSYTKFSTDIQGNQILAAFDRLINKYGKLLFLGEIVFYATFSYFLFKRAKQNFAEHLVLNSYKTSAILFINIVFIFIEYFPHNIGVAFKVNNVLLWITWLYGTWFYYQYFSVFYNNKFLLALRSAFTTAVSTFLFVLSIIYFLYFFQVP